jgi:hypothetical protein
MNTTTATALTTKMTETEMRETLRQMMADWDAMTSGQQACALLTAAHQARMAEKAPTSRIAQRLDRYASGRQAVREALR